jgi:hypothetical protein
MNITLEDYKAEILDLATNIMDEYGDQNDDDIFDYVIRETLDGHHWLTLTAHSGEVAQLSDNSDAYLELGKDYIGQTVIDNGIDGITALIAYLAMEADLTQAVQKMITCGSW